MVWVPAAPLVWSPFPGYRPALVRLLLVLFLAGGLVPGLGEVVETVTHYVGEGHLVHSSAERGDLGDQGHEHGCGTTEHHCTCCASQALGLSEPGPALPASGPPLPGYGPSRRLATLHHPAPPHRPPIGSSA